MTGRAPLAVVTVALNDLARLRETARSVWSQTPRPPLWIVVDGGSGDGTAEWLRANADRIAWWRSAPDRGLYHAMNIGLAVAESLAEAAIFLNAGDRFASIHVAEAVSEAFSADLETAFIYGDAIEEDDFGRGYLKRSRSHRTASFGMFTHHQSMAYRLSTEFKTVFDERFTIGSDYAFTLAAMGKARKIVNLAIPISMVAPSGISARNAELGRDDQFRIRREILGMGILCCAAVRLAQHASQLIRKSFPEIYFLTRFRSLNSREGIRAPRGNEHHVIDKRTDMKQYVTSNIVSDPSDRREKHHTGSGYADERQTLETRPGSHLVSSGRGTQSDRYPRRHSFAFAANPDGPKPGEAG